MLKSILVAASLTVVPAIAMAQTTMTQTNKDQGATGAVAGATAGAVGGAIVGGPVGAAIGAVGGAVVGGIAGASQPEFSTWVVDQKHPSHKWEKPVVVGATLPASGITYYAVPEKYGVKEYRYTVVNEHVVLVDPATHKIVQIVQ